MMLLFERFSLVSIRKLGWIGILDKFLLLSVVDSLVVFGLHVRVNQP
jgi:hypothetical protein